MRLFVQAIFVSLVIAGPVVAQSRPSGLETREDAYRRQQSEIYQQNQNNRHGSSLGVPRERFGDPPVNPTQRELNQWNQPSPYGQPQPSPYGTGKRY